jgi:glucose-1-phosphate adenylyltransferase
VILEIIYYHSRKLMMGIGLQQVDTSVLGLSPEEAKKMPYIASMGIYVFRKDILLKLLR